MAELSPWSSTMAVLVSTAPSLADPGGGVKGTGRPWHTHLPDRGTIHIGGDLKGGIGAIGFAFDCAWDEEHKLGLRWDKGEVVELGDGNVAGFIVE